MAGNESKKKGRGGLRDSFTERLKRGLDVKGVKFGGGGKRAPFPPVSKRKTGEW